MPMIDLFQKLDVYENLVENAELCDIGSKKMKLVPKRPELLKSGIEFQHQFLIYKQ
jgi:hypothetical protein